MKNQIQVLSHIYTGISITVVYRDKSGIHTKIITEAQPNWRQVIQFYKNQQFEKMCENLEVAKVIEKKTYGKFSVNGNEVFYRGEKVSGYLFDRILMYMREGLPFKHLLNFAENLFLNPSKRAVDELYKYLETRGFPITEDGNVMSYKAVRQDYYSITSGNLKLISGKTDEDGHIYNGVGEVIECDRNAVDDNCNNTCAVGIHTGNLEYCKTFGGDSAKIVLVKFNPRDAVSVPIDENSKKIRVCKYEVISDEGSSFEVKALSEIKDIHYDKVAKAKNKTSKQKRDAHGRFC